MGSKRQKVQLVLSEIELIHARLKGGMERTPLKRVLLKYKRCTNVFQHRILWHQMQMGQRDYGTSRLFYISLVSCLLWIPGHKFIRNRDIKLCMLCTVDICRTVLIFLGAPHRKIDPDENGPV